MKIIQELTLDTHIENAYKMIVAKQYDEDSRFIRVTIAANKQKIDVPQECIVTLEVKRADFECKVFEGLVEEGGTVLVPLVNWMLVHEGKCTCSIAIIQGTEKLSTLNFTVAVEKSPVCNKEIEEDENYDILVKLINEVQELKEDFTPIIEAFFENSEVVFDGGDADSILAILDDTLLG